MGLNERLRAIVEIDHELTTIKRVSTVVQFQRLKDLRNMRRQHVIAIESSPRGKTTG